MHHGTKNLSQSRGASVFVDAVRLVYKVEVIKNEQGEVQEDDKRSPPLYSPKTKQYDMG